MRQTERKYLKTYLQSIYSSEKQEQRIQQASFKVVQLLNLLKSLNNDKLVQQIIKKQSNSDMEERNRKGRFLDVTQYVLKEYSPLSRALNPDPRLIQRNYHHERYTPQIAPIDHDGSTLKITPFLNGLIDMADAQFQQFILDSDNSSSLEGKSKDRYKLERIKTRVRSNSLVLFHFDNQLQGIIQEQDFQFNSAEQSSSHRHDFDEDDFQSKSVSQQSLEPLPDLNQAQINTQIQFRDKIEKYSKDPKLNLIKQIRRLSQLKQNLQSQKLNKIKNLLQGYILDFQVPSFQEAWQTDELDFQYRINMLCKGIQENFKRKIGSLPFEGRRIKLLKYLQKKRLRRWRKKVSYDCRKKVADSRLRIKGKFVNREQVCQQLGISLQEICNYTAQEIRELLERRMQEGKEKSQSQ